MSCGYWHNYQTGEMDFREAPETDEEMRPYLPQDPSALGLYQCHREMGKSIMDAAIRTYKAVLGEVWTDDEDETPKQIY